MNRKPEAQSDTRRISYYAHALASDLDSLLEAKGAPGYASRSPREEPLDVWETLGNVERRLSAFIGAVKAHEGPLPPWPDGFDGPIGTLDILDEDPSTDEIEAMHKAWTQWASLAEREGI